MLKVNKILEDGFCESKANDLFDKIEKFGSYGFCKSHALAYSLLSFQSAWLKAHYPEHFYVGALSIEDDEANLKRLVEDAAKKHIRVVPPDINISTDSFVIERRDRETWLYAPFQKIKGCSDTTTSYILQGRKKAGGSFKDMDDFISNVNKSKVNAKHRDALERVGALASITPEAPDFLDESRVRSQIELLPGLILQTLKIERSAKLDKVKHDQLLQVYMDSCNCKACSLREGCHPKPFWGNQVKFMVVSDCPSWSEDKEGKMMHGFSVDTIKTTMARYGISAGQGYYTSLVKSAKPKDARITTSQIGACTPFLEREIATLNPPVILTLGSNAARYFNPELKGAVDAVAGQVFYHKGLDANIIYGINPAAIHFAPEKQLLLNKAFEALAKLI